MLEAEKQGSGDFNVALLRPVCSYVRDRFGGKVLAEILARVELDETDLSRRTRWITVEQFCQVLEAARGLMKDENEFLDASGYRLRESTGPLVALLYATSIEDSIRIAARTFHLVSRVSRFKILEARPSYLHLEYQGTKKETRLVCLSRLGWYRAVPTLIGLPTATIQERSCIGLGDDACRYIIRWQARARWKALVLGLGLGIGTVALIGLGWPVGLSLKLLLPVLGLSLALVIELRRAYRTNLQTQTEVVEGLQEAIEQAQHAQAEVLALSHRQESWAQIMEEQIAERTARLQEVVARVARLRERRAHDIQGISHDLRNPLTVAKCNIMFLQRRPVDAEAEEMLAELAQAVNRIDEQLKRLLESATSDTGAATLTPTTLSVEHLSEQIRRRLKALVLGKNIRTTVLTTREAPETIESDEVLVDRVVDNLLTNAAKYTQSGSIVVEVAGVPGMLCVKVSDTGRGIANALIEEIFTGRGLADRSSNSYGVGLAGVVRLLAAVGGRLEVLSKPDVGTTFWAYLPATLRPGVHATPAVADGDQQDLVGRVVTIRRNATG